VEPSCIKGNLQTAKYLGTPPLLHDGSGKVWEELALGAGTAVLFRWTARGTVEGDERFGLFHLRNFAAVVPFVERVQTSLNLRRQIPGSKSEVSCEAAIFRARSCSICSC
jgi:hypothetical protein